MIILFANFLLYAFVLYQDWRKERKLTLYSFLLLVFAMFAFMGWYTYFTGTYQNVFGEQDEYKFSFLPYIFAFACILLMVRPLKGFTFDLSKIAMPSPKVMKWLNAACFVLMLLYVYMAVRLQAQKSLFQTYAEMYGDAAAGDVETFGNGLLDFVYGKLTMLSRVLPLFVYFSQFNYIRQGRSVFLHMGLVVAMLLLQVVPMVFTANRGGMFFTVFLVIAYAVYFWPVLTKAGRRFLVVGATSVALILGPLVWAISLSRGGDDVSDAFEELVLRYIGEPFPNLGFAIWEQPMNHPYGERFFPSLLSTDTALDNLDAGRSNYFNYWEGRVGISVMNFKTIFGDLYIEFGLVGAFIFIFLLQWLAMYYRRHYSESIFDLILVFFYVFTCLYAVFDCYWGREQTWKDLIYIIIIIRLLDWLFIKKPAPDVGGMHPEASLDAAPDQSLAPDHDTPCAQAAGDSDSGLQN